MTQNTVIANRRRTKLFDAVPAAARRAACLFTIVCGAAFGQSAETGAKFEIADIHTSPHSSAPNVTMRSGFYKGGRYEVRSATMVDLVGLAYGVDGVRVVGGPNWLETDRYDVIAIAPANSTAESVKTMLQALLADRFKLLVHTDKKEMPSYALTAGKQPKLKEADGAGETGCQFEVQGVNNGGGRGGPDAGPQPQPTLSFKCSNMTMAAFADYTHTMPTGPQFLGPNPILDDTGLAGAWNFDFHFTIGNGPIVAGSGPLFEAIDKQLGLKLEPRKVPIPVVMVDSVNQKPTDNLPGIAEKLPVAATEFEVADIKPSDPSAPPMNGNPFRPGGRLELRGFPLKIAIAVAWDTTPDKVVGGPKNLDDDKYDIIAKAPASTTTVSSSVSNNQAPMDIDALRLMLRALLIDRFKMKTHTEDRPGQAYTLVATKPKMKKADPSNRTGFKEGPGPDGKDPRKETPALARLVTCTNMTMGQLADALPRIASGYFQNASTTVIDATGLTDAYDFTLSFSTAAILNGGVGGGRGGDAGPAPGPGGGGAGGAPEASDPGGGMTLYDAMEKQIGIKVEIQKRPMPVLVIDHIEPKPTDN